MGTRITPDIRCNWNVSLSMIVVGLVGLKMITCINQDAQDRPSSEYAEIYDKS